MSNYTKPKFPHLLKKRKNICEFVDINTISLGDLIAGVPIVKILETRSAKGDWTHWDTDKKDVKWYKVEVAKH